MSWPLHNVGKELSKNLYSISFFSYIFCCSFQFLHNDVELCRQRHPATPASDIVKVQTRISMLFPNPLRGGSDSEIVASTMSSILSNLLFVSVVCCIDTFFSIYIESG